MQGHIRTLRASAYGNFMEWFDFTLYGFFAVAIGRNFFPADNPLLSTMASYTAFAAGFVARPIGAFVFGRWADRLGRRQVLVTTLLLMGLATLLVVAAPGYQSAGLLGPVMVVCGRLLAGLAAAGETGAAVAMAFEAAPADRRGRWGGWFSCSTYMGVAAGGSVALLCYGLLGTDATNDWGWRMGYAVGLLIVPLGWWARRNAQATHPAAETHLHASTRDTVTMVARVAGLTAFGSSVFYVVIMFLPVYASSQLGLQMSTGMGSAMVASIIAGLAAVLGGWMSDRHGRKRVMHVGVMACMAMGWPLFLQLLHAPSAGWLAAFQWVCAGCFGVFVGGSLPLMVESFPLSRRALGVGLGYSLGVMVFGAFAPVVNALALSKGVALAPLFYVTGTALVTWLTLLWMPEPRRELPHDLEHAPA